MKSTSLLEVTPRPIRVGIGESPSFSYDVVVVEVGKSAVDLWGEKIWAYGRMNCYEKKEKRCTGEGKVQTRGVIEKERREAGTKTDAKNPARQEASS